MGTRQLHRFLVEQYVPQLTEPVAVALAARLERASARMRDAGTPIQWVHAVALPDEENLMCFIDAETIEHVLEASRLAETTAVHVQQVVALNPGSQRSGH
jgi:hypothetical protein